MRRKLLFMGICFLLFLCLAAYAGGKSVEKAGEPVYPTYVTGYGEQTDGGFQVYIPKGWEDVAVENYETDISYALEFFHTDSRESGAGGHLVSIHAFPEEVGNPGFPQERELGVLRENGTEGAAYILYAVFPSDVQSEGESLGRYRELSEDVGELLDSLEAREGFTFTPAPGY